MIERHFIRPEYETELFVVFFLVKKDPRSLQCPILYVLWLRLRATAKSPATALPRPPPRRCPAHTHVIHARAQFTRAPPVVREAREPKREPKRGPKREPKREPKRASAEKTDTIRLILIEILICVHPRALRFSVRTRTNSKK